MLKLKPSLIVAAFALTLAPSVNAQSKKQSRRGGDRSAGVERSQRGAERGVNDGHRGVNNGHRGQRGVDNRRRGVDNRRRGVSQRNRHGVDNRNYRGVNNRNFRGVNNRNFRGVNHRNVQRHRRGVIVQNQVPLRVLRERQRRGLNFGIYLGP